MRRYTAHGDIRRPLQAAAVLATVLALLLGTTLSSSAAMVPRSPLPAAVPADKVADLTRQIAALEKAYGGDLAKLRDARVSAKKALHKSQRLDGELKQARTRISRLASAQYKSSGIDPTLAMITGQDPNTLLDGAVLAEHVSATRAAEVRELQTLVRDQKKARAAARETIDELEADIKKTLASKDRAKALLRKYKPESPMIGASGLTARMVTVRTEIESKFGPFIAIGCLRPGDPQDHGSGRACDFMESAGGAMPSAERTAHGDQVADYAIDNASRLGVKYVIWRQRIYDMRSPGWDPMSDRGSITANHMDHPHISVF